MINDEKKLVAFITAGYPSMYDTKRYICDLIDSGVDIIEIGIPFSDPIAGGLIIEKADIFSLQNGTTTDDVFSLIKEMHDKYPKYPFILKSYLNTAFRYGYKEYFKMCEKVQVQGVIFIDLPFEEIEEIKSISDSYNVHIINLIAPTSKNRIKRISKASTWFINLVPSIAKSTSMDDYVYEVKSSIKEVKETNPDILVYVSSDVSTLGLVSLIKEYADGIIIDTGIMDIIDKYQNKASSTIKLFVNDFKDKLK